MKNKLRTCTVVRVWFLPFLAAAQAAKTEASKAATPTDLPVCICRLQALQGRTHANSREVNDIVAGAPGGASAHAGHGVGSVKGVEMPTKTMPCRDSDHNHGGKP